jgi:hypothetical protein
MWKYMYMYENNSVNSSDYEKYCNFCWWDCRPNCARKSSKSLAPIVITFTRNPNMALKMAYESKWKQIGPSHLRFKKGHVTPPPVQLNNIHLPQTDSVKYLGIHLDRKLTWHNHISAKWKQLELKLRNTYWIIGRKSQVSLANKLLVYKAILKPIWTYGIQLWGTASASNIDILEMFQSKVLRIITDDPWYVPNAVIKRDLQVPSVRQEVRTLLSPRKTWRSSQRSSYSITTTTTSQSQTQAVLPRRPRYSFLTDPLRTPQQPQTINCDCA